MFSYLSVHVCCHLSQELLVGVNLPVVWMKLCHVCTKLCIVCVLTKATNKQQQKKICSDNIALDYGGQDAPLLYKYWKKIYIYIHTKCTPDFFMPNCWVTYYSPLFFWTLVIITCGFGKSMTDSRGACVLTMITHIECLSIPIRVFFKVCGFFWVGYDNHNYFSLSLKKRQTWFFFPLLSWQHERQY